MLCAIKVESYRIAVFGGIYVWLNSAISENQLILCLLFSNMCVFRVKRTIVTSHSVTDNNVYLLISNTKLMSTIKK